jgi:hypothetical protein
VLSVNESIRNADTYHAPQKTAMPVTMKQKVRFGPYDADQ